MVTKGTITINVPEEAAYDALAACKDMGAKVKCADRESFVVDGESGTMWLQNRFSFRFYARVRTQYDGALLEFYDFSPKRVDKRFLGTLFGKLKKRVSVGEPDYKDVDSIEPESNQGPRQTYLPTRPVQPRQAHATVQSPPLIVERGRIKGREYRVKIEGGRRGSNRQQDDDCPHRSRQSHPADPGRLYGARNSDRHGGEHRCHVRAGKETARRQG